MDGAWEQPVTPDVPADSSPAPDAALPVDPLDAAVRADDTARFKAIKLAERTGQPIPEPQVTPLPADAAPAEPAEQAASTDATPKTDSEPVKPKHNAETRIRQLASENKDLRARLERLERPTPAQSDVKQAESSPAKPQKGSDRYMAMPGAPKFEDFDTIEAFVAEAAVFIADQRESEREQQTQAKQKGDAFTSMQSKGDAAFEDFRDVLIAAEQAGLVWPESIVQLVLSHERGHEIAYLLAKERIADPVKAGMAIKDLLADKAESVSPVPPSPKAPPPATQLGSNTHDVRDPLWAAVRSDDIKSFKAQKLAERVAAARR